MKKILCFLTRRLVSHDARSGFFSRHANSCDQCRAFFQDVHSLEQDLRLPVAPHDEVMCRDIMRTIRTLEPRESRTPARAFRRWLPAAGLATAGIAVLVATLMNSRDNDPPAVVSRDPVPVVAEEEPAEVPGEETISTIASLVEQQKLLRRDAKKLGSHLRERVILFQSTD